MSSLWFPWKQEFNILTTAKFQKCEKCFMQASMTSHCEHFSGIDQEKKNLHTVCDNNKKLFITGNHRKCLLQTKLKSQVLITMIITRRAKIILRY